jgi:tetratricopeptide (TPR) repeat protein
MILTSRTRSPLLLLVPALAVAALVALAAVRASHPGPRSAAPALRPAAPPATAAVPAPPSSLTTRQLIARYTAELRTAPGKPRAYEDLALAELQMAREDGDPSWYTRADRLLRHAAALDPTDSLAIAAQGSLANSRHDFLRGLALGRRALRLDRGSAYALGVIVDANVELGRYAAARGALTAMLDAQPGLSAYSRAAYLLELEGRTDAARRMLRAAVGAGATARENGAWVELQLGNLEFGHGRYVTAERDYRLAARMDPGFVHAAAALARVDAARGRYAAAIRRYRAVVARYPLPAYVIALGDVYRVSGDRAAAARQYALVRAEERLYIANGVNVDAELALFEADHGGNPADALARARAVAAVQHSVVADDVLAWTLFHAGRPHAALAAANRALRLHTADASFLYHRGAIEAALGLRAAARADLRHALALNPRFSPLLAPRAAALLRRLSR